MRISYSACRGMFVGSTLVIVIFVVATLMGIVAVPGLTPQSAAHSSQAYQTTPRQMTVKPELTWYASASRTPDQIATRVENPASTIRQTAYKCSDGQVMETLTVPQKQGVANHTIRGVRFTVVTSASQYNNGAPNRDITLIFEDHTAGLQPATIIAGSEFDSNRRSKPDDTVVDMSNFLFEAGSAFLFEPNQYFVGDNNLINSLTLCLYPKPDDED